MQRTTHSRVSLSLRRRPLVCILTWLHCSFSPLRVTSRALRVVGSSGPLRRRRAPRARSASLPVRLG
eukprot:12103089-Alexandrium_andersonii.AAC.1